MVHNDKVLEDVNALLDYNAVKDYLFMTVINAEEHKNDLATMPPALQEVFKKSKTANNTSFALKLIYDYGFNFGKEQDISQIKSMSSDLKAFDLGYSA